MKKLVSLVLVALLLCGSLVALADPSEIQIYNYSQGDLGGVYSDQIDRAIGSGGQRTGNPLPNLPWQGSAQSGLDTTGLKWYADYMEYLRNLPVETPDTEEPGKLPTLPHTIANKKELTDAIAAGTATKGFYVDAGGQLYYFDGDFLHAPQPVVLINGVCYFNDEKGNPTHIWLDDKFVKIEEAQALSTYNGSNASSTPADLSTGKAPANLKSGFYTYDGDDYFVDSQGNAFVVSIVELTDANGVPTGVKKVIYTDADGKQHTADVGGSKWDSTLNNGASTGTAILVSATTDLSKKPDGYYKRPDGTTYVKITNGDLYEVAKVVTGTANNPFVATWTGSTDEKTFVSYNGSLYNATIKQLTNPDYTNEKNDHDNWVAEQIVIADFAAYEADNSVWGRSQATSTLFADWWALRGDPTQDYWAEFEAFLRDVKQNYDTGTNGTQPFDGVSVTRAERDNALLMLDVLDSITTPITEFPGAAPATRPEPIITAPPTVLKTVVQRVIWDQSMNLGTGGWKVVDTKVQ